MANVLKIILTLAAFFFVFAFSLYYCAEWAIASQPTDPTAIENAKNLIAACFVFYAISGLLLLGSLLC